MIGCYILYTKTYDRYYVGATQEDPITRLQKHNNKFYGGTSSSYTNDWELFLFIACSSYPQAIRLERHIKSMKSTSYISNLAKYPEMIEKLVKKYSWAPDSSDSYRNRWSLVRAQVGPQKTAVLNDCGFFILIMIGCYILYIKTYYRFYVGAIHEDPISRLQKHKQ